MTAKLSNAGVPITSEIIRQISGEYDTCIKIYVIDQEKEKKGRVEGAKERVYVRASLSYLCTSLLQLPSQLRPFAFTSSHSPVLALKACR